MSNMCPLRIADQMHYENDGYKTLYYPRLQVTRHGEILLALYKKNGLTSGVLVGYTEDCCLGEERQFPIGQKFDDWEVGGKLEDYDGEVTVTFANEAV